jgi:hypothetical protein
MPPATPSAAPPAWLLAPRETEPAVELFGLSPEERLRRSLRNAGVTRVERFAPEERPQLPAEGSLLLFRTDAVYDERLVRGLLDAPGSLLVASAPGEAAPGPAVAAHVPAGSALEALAALRETRAGGALPASLRVVTPRELAPAYAAALRKVEPPFLFAGVRPADARGIEDHLFAASYKGLTDLVTKWVWPRPAAALVRELARRQVHPNSVTLASWILALLAFGLFLRGQHALGLVAAWLMTFLDTVDGKLARCTLSSSRFGHALDHSLDLVHPPFWWWAFGVGLGWGTDWATGVAVAGYFAGRLLEGIFLWRFGFEIFSWRPVDGLFRTVIARRNPNLLLLSVGALGGRPDLGLVMVALWTLACLGFHALRVAQALVLRARGGSVVPWNEATPAARVQGRVAKLAVVLLCALGASTLAAAAREPLLRGDPASRLLRAEAETEYWDFTVQLDTGHRVFSRFAITNEGPGDETAYAIGHVITPDGAAFPFQNGRRKGHWSSSPDGLRLEIGGSKLELGEPVRRLDVARKKLGVVLDLRFTPPARGRPQDLGLRSYWVDLLHAAAPVEGTLWLTGMSEPLPVRGQVAATHTWMAAPEVELALRRIEFFSLEPGSSVYLSAVETPEGFGAQRLLVERDGTLLYETDRLELVPADRPGAETRPGYPVPGALRLRAPGLEGELELGSLLLENDPMGVIPQPFRLFFSLRAKPHRVWLGSRFGVRLRRGSDDSMLELSGLGVTTVTFTNPLPTAGRS